MDVLGSGIGAGHSRYHCGCGGYCCQALAELMIQVKAVLNFLEVPVIRRSPFVNLII